MADVHRRIELQEQDDLRYLINNVLRVANENIDKNLPPVEGEDPLRLQVQELVHEYIAKTFTSAAPNLLINGHAVPTTLLSSLLSKTPADTAQNKEVEIEDYAPQNEKLRTRLIALNKTADALTLELAELRRNAPLKIVEARKTAFKDLIEGDDGAFSKSLDGMEIENGDDNVMVSRFERQAAVEASWTRGVEGLSLLKKEMGGTAARMAEAKKAGEFVLSDK